MDVAAVETVVGRTETVDVVGDSCIVGRRPCAVVVMVPDALEEGKPFVVHLDTRHRSLHVVPKFRSVVHYVSEGHSVRVCIFPRSLQGGLYVRDRLVLVTPYLRIRLALRVTDHHHRELRLLFLEGVEREVVAYQLRLQHRQCAVKDRGLELVVQWDPVS